MGNIRSLGIVVILGQLLIQTGIRGSTYRCATDRAILPGAVKYNSKCAAKSESKHDGENTDQR